MELIKIFAHIYIGAAIILVAYRLRGIGEILEKLLKDKEDKKK